MYIKTTITENVQIDIFIIISLPKKEQLKNQTF